MNLEDELWQLTCDGFNTRDWQGVWWNTYRFIRSVEGKLNERLIHDLRVKTHSSLDEDPTLSHIGAQIRMGDKFPWLSSDEEWEDEDAYNE